MSTNEISIKGNGLTSLTPESAERLILGGDLAGLLPAQRVIYYNAVCESVGLNPLTKPFDFIILDGRMVMYAKKECTEQLRSIKKVSITKLETTINNESGIIVSRAEASDSTGRTDFASGVVSCLDPKQGTVLKGGPLANAIMRSETKAKRRVTLSICGLGLMDESELDTIPDESLKPEVAMPARLSEAKTEAKPVDTKALVEAEIKQLPETRVTVDFSNVTLTGFNKKGVFEYAELVTADGLFLRINDTKIVDLAKGARAAKAKADVFYRVEGKLGIVVNIEPLMV